MTHVVAPGQFIPPGMSKEEAEAQAVRAARKFRAMIPTLTAFVRILTGRRDVRIIADGSNPRTDGKVIYMSPPFGLGLDVKHEKHLCDKRDPETFSQLCPACLAHEQVMIATYHEVAHIAHGSFDQTSPDSVKRAIEAAARDAIKLAPPGSDKKWADWVRKKIESAPFEVRHDQMKLANLVSEWLGVIVNALEDARVNNTSADARPGTRIMHKALNYYAFATPQVTPTGEMAYWSSRELNTQAVLAVFAMAAGYSSCAQYFAAEIQPVFEDEDLNYLLKDADKLRSSNDTFRLSFQVLDRLRELGFCLLQGEPLPPEPPQLPEEQQGGGTDKSESEMDTNELGTEPDGGGSPPGEQDQEVPDDGGTGTSPGEASSSDDEGDGEGEESGPDQSDMGEDQGSPGDSGEASEAEGETSEEGDVGEGDSTDAAPSQDSTEDGDSPSSSESDDGNSATNADADPSEADPDGELDEPSSSAGGEGSSSDEDDVDASSEPSTDDSTESGDASGSEAPSGGGDGDSDLHQQHEAETSDDTDLDSEPSGGPQEGVPGDAETGSTEGPDDRGQAPGSEGSVDSASSSDPFEDDTQDWGDWRDEELDENNGGGGQDSTAAPESAESTDHDDSPQPPQDQPGDGADEPVDTGADQGLGGVTSEYADRNGTPDDARKALNDFFQHAPDDEDPVDPRGRHAIEDPLQPIMQGAVTKGMYFEKSPVHVAGVRVHTPDNHQLWPDGTDAAEAFTGQDSEDDFRSSYSPVASGIQIDADIPEQVLGPALLKMRRVFDENRRSGKERNLRSGRIRPGVLGRRGFTDDDRLFQKKRVPKKRDYIVLIGIDVSGSTFGMNLALAKRAALAQAELCHRTGVDFEVWAHSAKIFIGNGAPEPRRYSDAGFQLDMYQIKTADEPWSPKVQEVLETLSSDSDNLDGHSLEFYRHRIEQHTATDKIIMYYTDGKMPAANYDEELEVLQRELKTCKAKKIVVAGVGIRTDSPSDHGLPTVQVDNDEDLIKVVAHLEKLIDRN